MAVLRATPRATLTLKRPGSAAVVAVIEAEAAARGVDARRRIEWADKLPSRDAHLQRVANECDAFLDSWMYGAHMTGADALWAAVPLLTIAGYGHGARPAGFAGAGGGDGDGGGDLFGRADSRIGVAFARALGLERELVAASAKDFEALAVRVASRSGASDAAVAAGAPPPLASALRRRVARASLASPLFDAVASARRVERAYAAAWDARAASALPPLSDAADAAARGDDGWRSRYHVVVRSDAAAPPLAVRAVRAATAALDGTGAADEEVDSDEYGAVNASAVNATRRRLERAVAIGARLALGAPGALDRAAGDRIVRIGELRAELGALTGAM